MAAGALKAGLKSPKTTIAGLLAAVAGIAGEVSGAFERADLAGADVSVWSQLNWELVAAFVSMAVVALVARDADRSSQHSGVRP